MAFTVTRSQLSSVPEGFWSHVLDSTTIVKTHNEGISFRRMPFITPVKFHTALWCLMAVSSCGKNSGSMCNPTVM